MRSSPAVYRHPHKHGLPQLADNVHLAPRNLFLKTRIWRISYVGPPRHGVRVQCGTSGGCPRGTAGGAEGCWALLGPWEPCFLPTQHPQGGSGISTPAVFLRFSAAAASDGSHTPPSVPPARSVRERPGVLIALRGP